MSLQVRSSGGNDDYNTDECEGVRSLITHYCICLRDMFCFEGKLEMTLPEIPTQKKECINGASITTIVHRGSHRREYFKSSILGGRSAVSADRKGTRTPRGTVLREARP